MPSAIVSEASFGRTPTTSTSGRADLTAIAIPLQSPPPPTGTTTFARSGTSSSSSSPSEPWPATMSGSSNGWMNASPPSRARSLARTRQSSTESPPMCTTAPWPRAASVFAIGASAGTKTSQGTPIMRAAAASDCAWLPAEAATTPALQPSMPSAASFAPAPRTLKEPVRWRFSAFSATMPPARSEIVRVESIGVRRAVVATASRAASMSRPVTGEDSTVATRPGYMPRYTTRTMELALDAKAALAEGPRWDPRIERLLWVDIKGKTLHRFDPATGEDAATPLPSMVGAAAPTADPDRVLVALEDRLAIVDVNTHELEPLADIPHPHPGMRANDGAVDPGGRFWIGTMAIDEQPSDGALYRLDGRELTTVLEPVGLSNGLDWIGDRMYYVDTPTQRIDLLDWDGDEASNRRPFVTIEDDAGSPDGLVIDDEGGIWLALYGGAQVRRYSPDGELTEKLDVPADNVTAVWFAGNRLFITTARSPQPLGGALFVAEPGVSGPAARIFAG